MKRRLLNVAAVLSLLLCAATVVTWVRSHLASDVTYVKKRWMLVSTKGVLRANNYLRIAHQNGEYEKYLVDKRFGTTGGRPPPPYPPFAELIAYEIEYRWVFATL